MQEHQHITTDAELRDYCGTLRRRKSIAFDTEFVSEDTFRPELCLIQIAAGDELALIDPQGIDDLTPFWETLAAAKETIVHAGRTETEFCLAAVGKPPGGLFDVQLAAGLAGLDYPAAYATLITRLLGEAPAKHETRTDWRRRPLSQRQIEYALDDVSHLHPLRDALRKRLKKFTRLEWMVEETADWLDDVTRAASEERWRRLSGHAGLESRALAIVRELFFWREREAQRRDQPIRRVLRDDLIVELARRKTADPARIRAVRGLERGDLNRRMPEITACIQRALDLPDDACPERAPKQRTQELSVLGQFLFAALGSRCREANLAPNLVGTPNDIRNLIAYRAEELKLTRPPKLARGWRKEFVGRLFDDLLSGQKAVRVGDIQSEHPLVFE